MKLTVGRSALNVMGEIRGGNRSYTYIYWGHGSKMKCRAEVWQSNVLFTPCQVNINHGELWVSVKMI